MLLAALALASLLLCELLGEGMGALFISGLALNVIGAALALIFAILPPRTPTSINPGMIAFASNGAVLALYLFFASPAS